MQKTSIYTISFLLTLFYCFFLQASILQNFFDSPFKEFCSDNHKDNENNNNIDNLCSYHCCLGKSDDLYFEKDFSLNRDFLWKFVYFLVKKIAPWHNLDSSWKKNWPK